LKQAPRAWYDRLNNFLIKNDFKRGQVDTTLFRRTLEKDILVVQIYVDDIILIFGSTNASLCKEFSKVRKTTRRGEGVELCFQKLFFLTF